MLQAIISHTPLWVWAVLAYLLYRGVLALHDREVPFKRVLLFPLIMLGLSASGLAGRFQHDMTAFEMSLAAILAAACWAWQRTPRNVTALAGGANVLMRGSWRALAMTLMIFGLKYGAGVAQTINPALLHDTVVSISLALAYGIFAGISLGRILRICHLCYQARSRLTATAA